MNKSELLAEIVKISTKNWKDSKAPILTSHLGVRLLESNIDYKSILEGASLSDFLKAHSEKICLVPHPQHKAKVGVLPFGERFDFPDQTVKEGSTAPQAVPNNGPSRDERLKQSRGALYAFVRALSELPEADINSVVIPTRVLVRLLEGR